MALLHSEQHKLGLPAPNFSLRGIDDTTYSLESFADKKILVIIFMCNHCPYVQAQWDRFVKLDEQFRERGAQFVGINANDSANYPEDDFEHMKQYAANRKQLFPYVHDELQEVANAYGAVCTPDIFVYDGERTLAYHGRMDDNWKEPDKVTRHELAEAIEALLQGKKPSPEQHPSMGCSIKWKM